MHRPRNVLRHRLQSRRSYPEQPDATGEDLRLRRQCRLGRSGPAHPDVLAATAPRRPVAADEEGEVVGSRGGQPELLASDSKSSSPFAFSLRRKSRHHYELSKDIKRFE